MEPIKPMKLMVRSLASFVILASVIHSVWYLFREKYVPKYEQGNIPVVMLFKYLTGKDTKKRDNDKN